MFVPFSTRRACELDTVREIYILCLDLTCQVTFAEVRAASPIREFDWDVVVFSHRCRGRTRGGAAPATRGGVIGGASSQTQPKT